MARAKNILSGLSKLTGISDDVLKEGILGSSKQFFKKSGELSAKGKNRIYSVTNAYKKLESGEKLTNNQIKMLKDIDIGEGKNLYHQGLSNRNINKSIPKAKETIARRKAAEEKFETNNDWLDDGYNAEEELRGMRKGYDQYANDVPSSRDFHATEDDILAGKSDLERNIAAGKRSQEAGQRARSQSQYTQNADAAAESGGYNPDAAEGVTEAATTEVQQSGAASVNNGSGEKVPKTETPPTGTQEGDALAAAVEEETAQEAATEAANKEKAWYVDNASTKRYHERIAEEKQMYGVERENSIKDLKENLSTLKEAAKKGGKEDIAAYNEAMSNYKKNLQGIEDTYNSNIKGIDKGPGMWDYVQGHGYDKAAVGIGALGFAGSVAFGGAKSNAELYSNPF